MKLASFKHGRDGRLVVVSRDLSRAADAAAVAPTLQAAIENWPAAEPRLTEIADALEAGRIAHVPFDAKKCASPLPRSFGWADGSAYVNHVALVRKARGAEVPATFWTDPLMYRGASDEFIGPCDPILAADTAWGIDLEAEVAVVVVRCASGCVAGGHRAADPAADAGQRREVCAISSRPSSTRASDFCRARARPHSRRSRSRPTSSGLRSTARRCTCRY